jgi:hypothetical protein
MARHISLARKVGNKLLNDTIDRLQHVPSSRSLMAAISCTSLEFHAVPRKVRDGYTPTDGLELRYGTMRGWAQLSGLRRALWYSYFRLKDRIRRKEESTEPSPIWSSSRKQQMEGISDGDVVLVFRRRSDVD